MIDKTPLYGQDWMPDSLIRIRRNKPAGEIISIEQRWVRIVKFGKEIETEIQWREVPDAP